MKFYFFCNPAAGQAKKLGILPETIGKYAPGPEFEIRFSTHKGQIEETVKALSPDIIPVAVGGDGTINEVINGLLERKTSALLGIIPAGTVNVLANDLGIPLSYENAVKNLFSSRGQREIDIAHISAGGNSRYWTLMAGFGFDAETVKTASPALKRFIGSASYVLRGIGVAFSYRPGKIRVFSEKHELLAECDYLSVQNSRYYGYRYTLAPEAGIDDGLLDAACFRDFYGLGILLKTLALALKEIPRPALLRGTPLFAKRGIKQKETGNISFFRKKEFIIETDQPVPIQIDGDFFGYTPAKIHICEKAVEIII